MPIAMIAPEELTSYPMLVSGYLYPPADGTLIRADSSATVYVIENGARKGLNYQSFVNRGYSFGSVNVLPQSEVDQYQLGADILE